MKKILILVISIQASFVCVAQSCQDTLSRIEHIFSRYKPDNPGCQLAISRNGQIIFTKAWGMADLEHKVPLTTESIIEAGSVSKQFTAACILLLEQQGKLSLNDDVHKYIPELPDYGVPILLRNMMHHTSGLKDWENIVELAGSPEGSKVFENEDVLYILSKQKTLNHKPGAEFLYSNSNYVLFAIIIERVSGMELSEFSRKYIFEPAGMKHTLWRNHFREIVPNRAIAYGFNGQFYFTTMPNENVYGNGGLLTTAEDLLAWNNFYLSGKLGTPSLLSRQIASDSLNNGSMGNYAAGLFVSTSRGWKTISHGGSTAAYRCDLSYFPDFGLSFAWISNTAQFDREIEGIVDTVHGIFIKNIHVAEPEKKTKPHNPSPENLSAIAGWYRNTNSNQAIRLLVKDRKLTSPDNKPLIPISENIFVMEDGGKLKFWPSGRKGLLSIYPDGETFFAAVDSAQLTTERMRDYVGEYYSEEAETKFSVFIKDGKLVLHQNPNNDEMLEATYNDGFTYWQGTVYFQRDKQNTITGMKISLPRARNVDFRKL